ncbi:MAG TPA: hypothetical protein DD435_04860 [Cyanobacteria bacterium UBA8530]|nr:hypothetical protein [Cyanobacteria bacterium UBA8530]
MDKKISTSLHSLSPFSKARATEKVAPAPVKKEKKKKGKNAWMAELLFENTFSDAAMTSYQAPEKREGDPHSAFTQGELQGFTGMKIPKSPEEYRELLARTYDPKKRDLALAILEQPSLRMAISLWDARKAVNNRNLASEINRFVSALMGKVYDFNPAVAQFRDLPPGLLGQQDSYNNKIFLSPRLCGGRAREFLETLIHEQIHRLQAELMFRLSLSKKGKAMSLDERALAMYWKSEEPKYRSVLASGWDFKGDTLQRYRDLAQEYHAFETGDFVAGKVCPFDPPLKR